MLLQHASVALAVALVYFAAAKLGLALAVEAPQISAVWPPTGIALAAALHFGRRALPGIFAGALAANATVDQPLWIAAGIAGGNTLEALVGAALVVRLGTASDPVRLAVAFIVAAALAPLASAGIGVACLTAGGVYPPAAFLEHFRVWWVGDALGALVLAPALALWRRGPAMDRRQRVELGALGAAAALLCAAVFYLSPRLPFSEYIVFPFIIWGAMRTNIPATALVVAVCDAVAIVSTYCGFGPFAGLGPERGLLHLQIFVAVAAATGILLAAVAERQRASEEAARAHTLALEAQSLARSQAEAALRESETRLRLLADTIPQLAWTARGDGYIFWYNRQWYEYTGATPEQMEGWGWQSVHDPDVLPQVVERWRRSLTDGEPFEMVFPLKGADGTFRPFLTRVNPLRDQEGRIVYWFGTNTDISEIKRMEEALREEDRRKDEFLAMLAHELRNPLAPIANSLQILKTPGLDPAAARKAREVVERQVHHLVRLVDDLLDVSRLMRGRVELRKEPVELATVVARAVETVQPLLDERSHRLEVSMPDEDLVVDGDPVRLTQVVANLLSNSAKYTEPHGTIGITGLRDDAYAVLAVRDTGIGIAPELLPHVFDLFVQADHAAHRAQGGLGIGLTLAKNLLQMHGGQIEARSAGAGQGAEFVIRLPLRHEPLRAAGVPGGETKARTPARVKMLVVDDNKDAAESLAMLLELQGHDIRVAHDGTSALALAQTHRPAMVFLDIGMPGMDGYEVARRMRSAPETRHSVIAALTGWGQREDRARTAAAGFDHHLVKPVAPDVLEALISRIASEPGSRSQ